LPQLQHSVTYDRCDRKINAEEENTVYPGLDVNLVILVSLILVILALIYIGS